MNKIAAGLFVLAAILSACGNKQHIVYEQPPVAANKESAAAIPVTYKPMQLTTASLTPVHPQDIHTKLKEITFEGVTVYLYSNANDDFNIFASIQTSSAHYAVDGLIGYGNDPSAITVSQIDFNGTPLVKIEGFVGASAPLTQYIQLQDGIPFSFWEAESHVVEYDADMDGTKEMIVTYGGTIPETAVIKQKDEQYAISNLNELTNGSVIFDNQSNCFSVYYGLNKRPEQYKLTANGLEFVGYLSTQ